MPSSPPASPEPGQAPPDWPSLALPFGEGHDHTRVENHRGLSTPNFEVVGWNDLRTSHYGTATTDTACAATGRQGERVISVVESFTTDVAFVVLDVTSPADPTVIGELVLPTTHVYDIQLTPDAGAVVLATSPYDLGPEFKREDDPIATSHAPYFRNACTGQHQGVPAPVGLPEQLPYASGLLLIDLADPAAPRLDDFVPLPYGGPHSIRVAELQGRWIVFATVGNVPTQASYYPFFEIAETAAGRRLVPLSVYIFPDALVEGPTSTVPLAHDGFLQPHPVTAQDLAYIAYGGMGLVILDVTQPERPSFVSQWSDFGAFGAAGEREIYFHGVYPLPHLRDGRHYTFLGEECVTRSAAAPSCLLVLLDTTDPHRPSFISAWTLPVDVPWERTYEFSLHYFEERDGTLFLAAYHAGLWALDVSTSAALQSLPAVGVFVPDRGDPPPLDDVPMPTVLRRLATGTVYEDAPAVIDFDILPDGTLLVFDARTGMYAVQYDAARPAPAPEPWPLGPA